MGQRRFGAVKRSQRRRAHEGAGAVERRREDGAGAVAGRRAHGRVEIGLAFASFIVIGLGGGASGVLLPAQIEEYGIDKSVIGLLFFTFSAGYLLAGAANGWLMRRLGPRGDLVLGTATFSVITFACGLRPPFMILAALTVVFGFGAGVIDAGLNAYIAALPRSVVLLNLLHAFYGVGALVGPVLAASMLAAGRSWGAVYLVFAAAAVPLIVGIALRYPRSLPAGTPDVAPALSGEAPEVSPALSSAVPDATPAPSGESPSSPAQGSIFGAALRHPAVRLSALFLAVYVGIEISIGNWAFSFLVEERDQAGLLAGYLVSGFWLGFTIGRFTLSALAERFGVGPVQLAFGCLAGVMAATALIWLVPGVLAAASGLVLLGAALGPLYPLTIAVLPRMTPARLVPTAIGMLVGVSVLGGAFFPWVAGTLAENVGLGSLLPFTLVLGAALLANWWRLSLRLR